MTTYLGVAGWPVAHSRSPAMQNAALAAAGLDDWRYVALPLPPELFAETVRALPAAGFRGINVTIPHKEAALALADRASDAAREIGAANTLTFEQGGAISADNTDAPGLLEALAADGVRPPRPERARAGRRRGRAGGRVGADPRRSGARRGLEPDAGTRRGARRRPRRPRRTAALDGRDRHQLYVRRPRRPRRDVQDTTPGGR